MATELVSEGNVRILLVASTQVGARISTSLDGETHSRPVYSTGEASQSYVLCMLSDTVDRAFSCDLCQQHLRGDDDRGQPMCSKVKRRTKNAQDTDNFLVTVGA
jgi:hypothetical protein